MMRSRSQVRGAVVVHRLVVEPEDLLGADNALSVASQDRPHGAGAEVEGERVELGLLLTLPSAARTHDLTVLVGARHDCDPSAVERPKVRRP